MPPPRLLPLFAILIVTFALPALLPGTVQAQTPPIPKPVLRTLHIFDGLHGASCLTTLTQAADGNFYGITNEGGTAGNSGTVFRVTPQGHFTTLFCFDGINGGRPVGGLLQSSIGLLYGVTGGGGKYNGGTIFSISVQGKLMTLYHFPATDKFNKNTVGAYPAGGLMQAVDGKLYGTTSRGGLYGNGTIFSVSSEGIVSPLHSFRNSEGFAPVGTLVQGLDNAFYGTTSQRGMYDRGTVYRFKTDGTFSVLHMFNQTYGAQPEAGLVVGQDGVLYGTTSFGGHSKQGTLYRITSTGTFTTLHAFSNDGHGNQPFSALALGSDGYFYGTTTATLDYNGGTIYRMAQDGVVTTLYKFHTRFDGQNPYGGVIFGSGGVIYGTTKGAGITNGGDGYGTIYKLTLSQ